MQQEMIPLSRHQRAIWLEALLYPNQPIFNIGTYVLLDGIPEANLLEKAIQKTVDQHDSLRMQIVPNGAEPAVVFQDYVAFSLTVQSFENREEAQIWMEARFVEPIEIDATCLYEIQLVTFQEQSFLFLKHHHIYIDGWGRSLLVSGNFSELQWAAIE